MTANEWAFDWGKAQARKNEIVSAQVKGVHTLLAAAKILVKQGTGSLVDAKTVAVSASAGSEAVSAKAIILATGSEPRGVPGIAFDGERVLSSTEALQMPLTSERVWRALDPRQT